MEPSPSRRGHIVAISNQKGGVGKTTTVVNVAAYAGLAGWKTLVIDNDPQANATSALLPSPPVEGLRTVYQGQGPIPTPEPLVSLVPASPALLDDEKILARQDHGRQALAQRLKAWRNDYDLILIDCPPSLSALATNALVAARHLVLPLQCEYFAMEGLGQLLAVVDELQQHGADIAVLGIVLTMYDRQNTMARQVENDLRSHFYRRVFTTVIPRDGVLATAPSHGQSILSYDPLSPGGIAYAALTREVLRGLE